MNHTEQVAAWHKERPDWTLTFTAREWDVLERAAEAFDAALPVEAGVACPIPFREDRSQYCALEAGHDGACDVHRWDR